MGSSEGYGSLEMLPYALAVSIDAAGLRMRTRRGFVPSQAEHTIIVARRGSPFMLTSVSRQQTPR